MPRFLWTFDSTRNCNQLTLQSFNFLSLPLTSTHPLTSFLNMWSIIIPLYTPSTYSLHLQEANSGKIWLSASQCLHSETWMWLEMNTAMCLVHFNYSSLTLSGPLVLPGNYTAFPHVNLLSHSLRRPFHAFLISFKPITPSPTTLHSAENLAFYFTENMEVT